VIWGLIGSVGNAAGCMALYRGMARGQMSVVGPVSAVGAAVVPLLAGLAMGERPGLLSALGMIVALPAIALVAASGGKISFGGSAGLTDGLAAGAAFGVLFVAMAKAGQHSGLWPVAVETTGSLVLFMAMKLRAGRAAGHQDTASHQDGAGHQDTTSHQDATGRQEITASASDTRSKSVLIPFSSTGMPATSRPAARASGKASSTDEGSSTANRFAPAAASTWMSSAMPCA
jgi:hypothetical protein